MSEQASTSPFGLHLMVDAYNCPEALLNDPQKLYFFLEESLKRLDMHELTKPYIVHTEGNDHKDPGGWSGFMMIEESHISFHTFPKKGFVSIDAYSCRVFDRNIMINLIKEVFGSEDLEIFDQIRGTRFPDHNIY